MEHVPRYSTDDPKGAEGGEERVMRGGCYLSFQEKDVDRDTSEEEQLRRIRSASRSHLPADFELPLTGMRIVLAPEM
ncbi:hypothetical protein ACFL34_02740 [Candidatus Sumerlaeota bacterium]